MRGVCMEKTEQSLLPEVILDSGPIIHLDELDCLQLLADFKTLLIPQAVLKEVERHRPSALNINKLPYKTAPAMEYMNSHVELLCNAFSLDEGEIQAIALCLKQPNSILLTDDAAARLAAKTIGIRAYGTIGMLLRSIRRKQLTPVRVIKLLEDIPLKSTLYIKHTLLQNIIEEVKKEYSL